MGSTKYTLEKKWGIQPDMPSGISGKAQELKEIHYNFQRFNTSLAYNASEK